MTRQPLPVLVEGASVVEPVPLSVKDDDLIPECPLWLDREHVWYCQIQPFRLRGGIRKDGLGFVGIERRLRSRLDFHHTSNVAIPGIGERARVMEEQRLTVRILCIGLDFELQAVEFAGGHFREGTQEIAGNEAAATLP